MGPGDSSRSTVTLQMGALPGQRCAWDVPGMLPTPPHACSFGCWQLPTAEQARAAPGSTRTEQRRARFWQTALGFWLDAGEAQQ